MEDAPIEKIVQAYIKIRDTKDRLYQEYKEKNEELDEQMSLLKYKLIEISKEIDSLLKRLIPVA